MTRRSFLALAALPTVVALVPPRRLDQCNFESPPAIPYYWDPGCAQDDTILGCLADGIHKECRWCGQGDYKEVFCPAGWCEFDNPPHTPYFWDSRCSMGLVGCKADGKHPECRFCGEYPYNGSVTCPDNAHVQAPSESCKFDNKPVTPYFWDVTCEKGLLGCKADGKHIGCRFCGQGAYSEVKCPGSLCTFSEKLLPPSRPYRYYWDPKCWGAFPENSLGCLADGIHPQCRFCGSEEYESIPCPIWAL